MSTKPEAIHIGHHKGGMVHDVVCFDVKLDISCPGAYMDKKELAGKALDLFGKAAIWMAKKSYDGAIRTGEYIYDHREQIREGSKLAATAASRAATGFAHAVYDTASIKIYSGEKIDGLKKTIEEQGIEYRRLTHRALAHHRKIDSLAVGGDLLRDVLNRGASPDVRAAYAAAYPQLSQHQSFEEAVRSYSDDQLPSFISGVKGKLFEMKYTDYLNDGHLPSGYHANLAHSATQPGWDIAIHGPDNHIESVLQLKATDSLDYVKHALERYPDIDVVTTDEVYSQLLMNGAADHVMHSAISNADTTQTVIDSVDGSTIHMHWDLPVISLALIAFTTYTLEDADAYVKARHFGERSGKSYLSYLIGGGVACITQTWWLGLIAGMSSRFFAAKGKKQREIYEELNTVINTNNRVLQGLRGA